MNTHGHESISNTAGRPLLEDVFGKDNLSLNAFYLGNWLTDVSQLVDPVAYAAVSGRANRAIEEAITEAKNTVDRIIEEILATLLEHVDLSKVLPGEWGLRSCRSYFDQPEIKPLIDQAKQSLHDAIDYFFAGRTDERSSRLAQFVRSVCLVIGYFKFVHPTSPEAGARMNFECFMRVFGRPNDTRGAWVDNPAMDRPGAFTQYYPYHHLDRPEILPSTDPPTYAPGKQVPGKPIWLAPGKTSGTRSPRAPRFTKNIMPDLYSYLRDDIEMTAGLLAEMDLAFEKALTEGIRDNDPEWNITLAKLGHALHHVEDFFSHSNWIELAISRLGPEFLDKVFPPSLPLDFLNKAYTTYLKRLKRYVTVPFDDWNKHENEDWVVTGYFDFQDTFISIAHLAEEMFGWKVPDPWAAAHNIGEAVEEAVEHPKTVLHEVQQTMYQTLDFLTNPKRASEDHDNEVAQWLKKKYEPDLKKIRRPGISKQVAEEVAREVTFLRSAPPEIQKEFFSVIIEGSRFYTIEKVSFSIYGAIREIAQFTRNPLVWLKDWLPGWVQDKVVDALKFYAKELFFESLGANRIGCHSLLAKDHGLEPLYEQQKNCALAVHWYIVSTLLRWSDEERRTYIDWLWLLEYFLRNPHTPDKIPYTQFCAPISVTRIHKVKWGEQLHTKDTAYSLQEKYKNKALNPARFTWRDIADANFCTYNLPLKETQMIINTVLRDNAWGVPVKPPNYAFKEGLFILIPYQKAHVVFRIPRKEEDPWFKKVLETGWKVFKGYEDPEAEASVGPLQHHEPVAISRAELDQIITRGKKLRREAREAYRPSNR